MIVLFVVLIEWERRKKGVGGESDDNQENFPTVIKSFI